MAKTAWPTTTEVQDRVTGLGGSIPSGVSAQDEIDAVVAEIEECTRFRPFLAESSDSTRYFSPPDGDSDLLDIGNGYASITSVTVGLVAQANGSVLTVNADYWPLPEGATARKRPFTWIRFYTSPYGERESIKVVGKQGFFSEIPLDLWKAALDKAAGNILRLAAGASTALGQVTEITQGPVKLHFSDNADSGSQSQFDTALEAAIAKYRRL